MGYLLRESKNMETAINSFAMIGIGLCEIFTLVLYIMHCQYTTYIKQDAIITKLGDIWLHVSAVTGHLQAN